MSRNILVNATFDGEDSFTIGNGETEVVDIDCKNAYNAQFIIQSYYALTAGTTGISITVYYGIGPKETGYSDSTLGMPCVVGGVSNTDIWISDNGTSVSMPTFTTNSSAVTTNTFISTDTMTVKLPRWLRLSITNNDATNDVQIKIKADL